MTIRYLLLFFILGAICPGVPNQASEELICITFAEGVVLLNQYREKKLLFFFHSVMSSARDGLVTFPFPVKQ